MLLCLWPADDIHLLLLLHLSRVKRYLLLRNHLLVMRRTLSYHFTCELITLVLTLSFIECLNLVSARLDTFALRLPSALNLIIVCLLPIAILLSSLIETVVV